MFLLITAGFLLFTAFWWIDSSRSSFNTIHKRIYNSYAINTVDVKIPYTQIKGFLYRLNYDGLIKHNGQVISIVCADTESLALDVHQQSKKSIRYYIYFNFPDYIKYLIDIKLHEKRMKKRGF